MLPEIDEVQADFVLSTVKKGLFDLVRSVKLDDNNEKIIADLQPELVDKFHNKFPDSSLSELDNIVAWILMTAILKQKDTVNGINN